MPGEISRSNPGIQDNHPYVPSWCYKEGKPPMCSCGHHHGYHNDKGECLFSYNCECDGYNGVDPDKEVP